MTAATFFFLKNVQFFWGAAQFFFATHGQTHLKALAENSDMFGKKLCQLWAKIHNNHYNDDDDNGMITFKK